MKRIDYSLPPEEMLEKMDNCDDWIFFLEPDMSSMKLTQLFQMHINSKFCCEVVLSEISTHDNTPEEILEKLADNKDVNVLMSLALNVKVNREIIEKLLLTENYAVIEHLYWNKGVEKSVLVSLSKKHNLHTLNEVIANVEGT